MHRTDADANVANLFDEGDPGVPRNPTQVDAAWLNAVQEELCNAITNAGITLVKGTNTQLRSAMVNLLTAQTIAGIKTFTAGMVISNTAATGLAVTTTHASGVGVKSTVSGTGPAFQGVSSGADATTWFSNASCTATAFQVNNSGTGKVVAFENTGGGKTAEFVAATASDGAVSITNNSTGIATTIANAFSGKCLKLTSGSTGKSLEISHGGSGVAIDVQSNSGNSANLASTSGYAARLEGNATCAALHLAPSPAGFPSSAAEGDVFYSSDNHKLYVRTNGGWEQITSA